jgi:mono/diheme cytochrome c family protein/glucose/arabinose dehydrogenase/lysophospholipase L1-like esterase
MHLSPPIQERTSLKHLILWGFTAFALLGIVPINAGAAEPIQLEPESNLVLIGNGLGSRMLQFGHFETEVQRRNPGRRIVIRNLANEGDTPAFRPHSGRPNPFAFPGGEKYYNISNTRDGNGGEHRGAGFFEEPDQWLARLKADVIVAFFGFNESFAGAGGLDAFKAELTEFVEHTLAQQYNGRSAPRLALVSPIAFEDLSATHGTPNGRVENANLALYTAAMEDVAARHNVLFVNLFNVSSEWYDSSDAPLTRDGAQLNDAGYAKLAPALADLLLGKSAVTGAETRVRAAVNEKNWVWANYYKIPNGVHVFGRRHKPFGPDNYPDELRKLEQMAAIRDQAIWAALAGESFDLETADAKTHKLPEVQTNYSTADMKVGSTNYKYGEEALATMATAHGYQIELFASEKEFPNLANPVHLSFDNKGRLWVAVMPSYPHYQPGDPKPNDKLIILEDTNNDGKADKETIFAEGLHLPLGFEFAPEGVYVSQAPHLVLLKDTTGDDRADVREIVFSGFDHHDTHHAISAFTADPSGAILMAEGTFLHSNIETPYGPIRSSNGGFFRFDPRRGHLERTARQPIPNPWGIAFDDWGQDFYAETSSPDVRWMLPGTVWTPYGEFAPKSPNLIEDNHRVRPTSGLEFVSSRHFPDEVQGDLLICNSIGFLGMKQHQFEEDGTGFRTRFRHDLVQSSDGNFRPVDMEFAPDGSLYLVDWHNILVGHMQHSARDPLRDHVHGRIYRITYPSRPLVPPAKVDGATVEELLENLTLPEYRTRYRSRRELRARNAGQVLAAVDKWVRTMEILSEPNEHHLLEALWVTWGFDQADEPLLRRLLKAKDHRVRAAAVRVLRYNAHRISGQTDLLLAAAHDDHGRVRMEAIAAASWLGEARGLAIIKEAGNRPLDSWNKPVFDAAMAFLTSGKLEIEPEVALETTLTGSDRELFIKGAEVYGRNGHCITCHQKDGQGLPAAQFPPIAGTRWTTGSEERLIRLTLHGMLGPIEVSGQKYAGLVPMTPFRGLSDEEIAAVLTYVRNSFGNQASVITPDQVRAVREATKDQTGFYNAAQLLEQFPHDP